MSSRTVKLTQNEKNKILECLMFGAGDCGHEDLVIVLRRQEGAAYYCPRTEYLEEPMPGDGGLFAEPAPPGKICLIFMSSDDVFATHLGVRGVNFTAKGGAA